MHRLGDKTKTVFLKGPHGTDIHMELEAAGAINIGQPVKLDNDGKAVAAAADDKLSVIIGTSIHERADGEFVTIATRFRAVTYAKADDALVAGPVKYAGYDDGSNVYAALAGGGTPDGDEVIVGHSFNAADAADDEILVGLL